MKQLGLTVCLMILLSTTAAGAENTVIIDQGRSDYSIFSGKSATAAEKNAAKELQRYLEAATGVNLPITEKYTGTKQLLVGASPEAAALLPKVQFSQLKPDEILITPIGNSLTLAGDFPRGTLYAVYTFLENQLGIRFWTPSEEFIPQSSRLKMPDNELRYAPRIAIRAISSNSLMNDGAFAAKFRIHGPRFRIPAKWGGNVDPIGPWHTFGQFLPASKYFESHPEYFSYRDGKRVGDARKGQLCLSNAEMRREFLKNVLAELDKHLDPQLISITQSDNCGYCQCEQCQKIDNAGGGPSASMIRFVNYIAEYLSRGMCVSSSLTHTLIGQL